MQPGSAARVWNIPSELIGNTPSARESFCRDLRGGSEPQVPAGAEPLVPMLYPKGTPDASPCALPDLSFQ